MPDEPLTIATLNTRGIPLTGSRLAGRYAAIGTGFDAGDSDVVCCQEVFTYWHLRLLARAGWAGGRPGHVLPAAGIRPEVPAFRPPPRTPGVPRTARFQARIKGALVTQLADPELCVINTHPVASHDGHWSAANRYYPLHRAQLTVLAQVVNQAGPRALVCGDFNVSRESLLFGEFTAATGLADAFGGACPATFRAAYLPAGAELHCIDFILTGADVQAESAGLVFAEKEPTLHHASWPNTRICSRELTDEIRDLKAGGDVPLRTMGSLSLIRQLLRAGLVDRLRLMTFPLLAGPSGRDWAFTDMMSADLELADHRVLDDRVLLMEYRPTGKDIPRA